MPFRPLLLLLTAAGLLLSACGEVDEAVGDTEAWRRQGDLVFAAAEEEARVTEREPDFVGDAIPNWLKAARYYRNAFRLADPLPEAAAKRALLAFWSARALTLAALHGAHPETRRRRADGALFWLEQAEMLAPGLRQVWYERGLIRESDIEGVGDPLLARDAYRRYLIEVQKAGELRPPEKPRVDDARRRLEALGGEPPEPPPLNVPSDR